MLLCLEINSDASPILKWISSLSINKATVLSTSVQICLQTSLLELMAKLLLLLEVESGHDGVQTADTSVKTNKQTNKQTWKGLSILAGSGPWE